MFLVLYCLGSVSSNDILGAIGASSLGASTFIAFTFPDLPVSRARTMISSYLMAIGVGIGCHFVTTLLHVEIDIPLVYAVEICGALSLGVMMFLMISFHIEHPPAAGIALGLVLDQWGHMTLVVIITSIILIAFAKKMLRPIMVSLS